MTLSNDMENPFTFRFIDVDSKVFLELFNGCDQTLKSVEILTVVLKEEDSPGYISSKVSIDFADVKSIKPKEKVIVSHKTWIDGKPAAKDNDELSHLKVIASQVMTYVLDISWENAEGKRRFQRIPLRHGETTH
jgi:hypothetical protein